MKKLTVRVKKDFLDLETGLKRVQGKTMTVTESRFLELHRKGYVEAVKADTKPVGNVTETKK
jgi:hypothetical protein